MGTLLLLALVAASLAVWAVATGRVTTRKLAVGVIAGTVAVVGTGCGPAAEPKATPAAPAASTTPTPPATTTPTPTATPTPTPTVTPTPVPTMPEPAAPAQPTIQPLVPQHPASNPPAKNAPAPAPKATVAKTTAPAPAPSKAPATKAPATKAPVTTEPAKSSYKNCSEVRAAGKAPIRRGQPGYGKHLDRDGDGIGCE